MYLRADDDLVNSVCQFSTANIIVIDILLLSVILKLTHGWVRESWCIVEFVTDDIEGMWGIYM